MIPPVPLADGDGIAAERAPPRSASAPFALRLWLGALILLVFAMILVGGATRLTGSGLSITEWKPVTGALPPFGQSAWQQQFDLYRQSPQYELMNRGMSLAEFQTIYWWEWAHRQLGRCIGLVYLAGFLWFAVQRSLSVRDTVIFAGLGLLLAMQGLVGWIMVASGLEPGMTAVAPVRLALHLTLACLFFAALIAMFVRFGATPREVASNAQRGVAWALVGLAFIQIALGGLVAGHDAGLTYNSWPLMDGRLVPSGLRLLEPGWVNLVDNVATIQFNHRIGAYVLTGALLAYWFSMRRRQGAQRGRALLLAWLVVAQVVLGIVTLVQVVPTGLALAHQGMAMILLLALVWNASVLSADR